MGMWGTFFSRYRSRTRPVAWSYLYKSKLADREYVPYRKGCRLMPGQVLRTHLSMKIKHLPATSEAERT
jgi:hypothetical protein